MLISTLEPLQVSCFSDWPLPKHVLPASYFDNDDEFDNADGMDDKELLDSTLELEKTLHKNDCSNGKTAKALSTSIVVDSGVTYH